MSKPHSNGDAGAVHPRSWDDPLMRAARNYACEVMGCSSDGVAAVGRFPGGKRHAVYSVSFRDGAGVTSDVVVRVSNGGQVSDCEDAAREAGVLRAVEGHGAPSLYDFRCHGPWFETPVMCMEFVHGRHLELSSMAAPDIGRLGLVLADVHRRPTEDLDEWLGPTGDFSSCAEDRLRSIFSGMSWARPPLPLAIRARLTDAAEVLTTRWAAWRRDETFRTDEPLALLHGDPSADNILWDAEPVLIDWEYARLGDPADEIGYLFDQNGLSAVQRLAFWESYGRRVGAPADVDRIASRVEWWLPLTLFGSTLWWVERWTRRADAEATGEADAVAPKELGYYSEGAKSRLRRLEDLLT